MVVNEFVIASSVERSSSTELDGWLLGDVIRPGDPEYDSGRKVLNAAADRYPGLIVRAADAADVIRVVRYVRERGLPLAVRSGGHSIPGVSTLDGGVLLDLSRMKGLSIDPERKIAWAQPGLTWGEYAMQAQAYGLATSSGDSGTVGVGGLIPGGGIGWMVRKHGLTIDHLLSVEMVTADGRLVTASEEENPDLFWALRGGGGNFGIATAYQLRLHEVGTVLGGALVYEPTVEVISAWARYADEAPDELTTIPFLFSAPPLPFIPAEYHGKLVFAVLLCYAGDLEAGERVVAPLRQIGPVIGEAVGPMPYPGLFAFTEEASVPGRIHDVRSGFLDRLDEGLIATILEHASKGTSPMSMVQLRGLGGAMARVPAEATAFAHRDKRFMFTAINLWEDPADSPRQRAWTQGLWDAVRPYTAGVYVNFLGEEGDGRIREAYGDPTLDRLAAIKRKYDPTNLFKRNQNIKPQG